MEISRGFRHQWCKAFIIDPPLCRRSAALSNIIRFENFIGSGTVKKFNRPRIDATESETAEKSRRGCCSAHRRAWRIPPVNHIHGKRIRRAITKAECELARAGWGLLLLLLLSCCFVEGTRKRVISMRPVQPRNANKRSITCMRTAAARESPTNARKRKAKERKILARSNGVKSILYAKQRRWTVNGRILIRKEKKHVRDRERWLRVIIKSRRKSVYLSSI